MFTRIWRVYICGNANYLKQCYYLNFGYCGYSLSVWLRLGSVTVSLTPCHSAHCQCHSDSHSLGCTSMLAAVDVGRIATDMLLHSLEKLISECYLKLLTCREINCDTFVHISSAISAAKSNESFTTWRLMSRVRPAAMLICLCNCIAADIYRGRHRRNSSLEYPLTVTQSQWLSVSLWPVSVSDSVSVWVTVTERVSVWKTYTAEAET